MKNALKIATLCALLAAPSFGNAADSKQKSIDRHVRLPLLFSNQTYQTEKTQTKHENSIVVGEYFPNDNQSGKWDYLNYAGYSDRYQNKKTGVRIEVDDNKESKTYRRITKVIRPTAVNKIKIGAYLTDSFIRNQSEWEYITQFGDDIRYQNKHTGIIIEHDRDEDSNTYRQITRIFPKTQ